MDRAARSGGVRGIADLPAAGARLLRLLADDTRRRIFLALMRGETCNCELVGDLGLAQNLISHHIRALREGGFVVERHDEHDARWNYYRVNQAALGDAWQALSDAFHPSYVGTRTQVCGPAARNAQDGPL